MDLGDVTQPWSVEIVRRSVAMLAPSTPAPDREDACTVLEALADALDELRRLRQWRGLDE